jgi:hypothetical protein
MVANWLILQGSAGTAYEAEGTCFGYKSRKTRSSKRPTRRVGEKATDNSGRLVGRVGFKSADVLQ